MTNLSGLEALLSEEKKEQLKELNIEETELTTKFNINILEEVKHNVIVVDDISELNGLSSDDIEPLAQAGKDKGLEGKWVITLQKIYDSRHNGQIGESQVA